MNILVTGGCGFIGSHTVDRLISENHSVTVIDDLSAPENAKFYYNNNAKYFHFDILDLNDASVDLGSIDVIYHLAARSRIQPTFKNPSAAFDVNVSGTQRVLEWARMNDVKKIIYSGTSSLYGYSNPTPYTPDMSIECNTPYAMSKWLGERLCEFYSRTYNIDAVVLRYFNVYGPREPINGHYAPVVGLFKRQKKLGKKITIIGSGEQRRDFTYIDDVVQANIFAMNAEKKFTILNVGTGKNYSINELAYMICSDKSQFEYISGRRSELKETLADITKTQKEIGWSPSRVLEDMLMSY